MSMPVSLSDIWRDRRPPQLQPEFAAEVEQDPEQIVQPEQMSEADIIDGCGSSGVMHCEEL